MIKRLKRILYPAPAQAGAWSAVRWAPIAGILCVAALLLGAGSTALAQSPAPQAAPPAAAYVSSGRPSVQIVSLVLPTGQTAISSVYPGEVAAAQAQARVTRLLQLASWKATGRRFSNASAAPNLLEDDSRPKLSAASFQTDASVANFSDGTIDWEPFLRSFGDLPQINIICFTGPGFTYRGPVQFDSDRISLHVYPGKGTVTCVAKILKPEASPAPFGIPRYEPIKPLTVKRDSRATQNAKTRRIIGFIILATFAAGVALFIYSWSSRYSSAGNIR